MSPEAASPARHTHQRDALILAEAMGEAWGKNRLDAFVALFAPNGDIVHPYFKTSISPTVAMEVMNAAVSGETRLVEAKVIDGDGSGRADEVVMLFEETGDMNCVAPVHIGQMMVRAKIRDGLIDRMTIDGLLIVTRGEGAPIEPRLPERPLTSQVIAERLADTWSGNDMAGFLGLFAPGALIDHCLLAAPAPPQVVAEVMNCNVKGTTRLSALVLMKGDGAGRDDVLDLEFEETGVEIGFEPTVVGRMSITADVQNHQVTRLAVFGYQVVERAV
jgi:hypothetical protein